MFTKFLTFVLIVALLIGIVYPIVMGLVGLVISILAIAMVLVFTVLVFGGPIAIVQQTWSEIFKR